MCEVLPYLHEVTVDTPICLFMLKARLVLALPKFR